MNNYYLKGSNKLSDMIATFYYIVILEILFFVIKSEGISTNATSDITKVTTKEFI